MFTGIIHNQGVVAAKKNRGGQIRFSFRFRQKEKKVRVGESIAVEGVCLTAVRIDPRGFDADVVGETLRSTSLGALKIKDGVNLERSLKVGDEIGGHFVSGHVDGVGVIKEIQKFGRNILVSIEAPVAVQDFLAVKGSIAIDGISFTVQAVAKPVFKVAVIPHTWRVTTLGLKRIGGKVNLEADLIARYLEAIFSSSPKKTSGLSRRVLKKQGF